MTGHKPNTFLDGKPSPQFTRRQVGWQQHLSRFHYQWEYEKGIYNNADPLSRNPALMNTVLLDSLPGPSKELQEKMREGYAKTLGSRLLIIWCI